MTNLITPKCGCCFIVPLSVLRQLAQAEQIETADRDRYQRSYATTQQLRLVREGHRQASLAGHQSGLDLRATAVAARAAAEGTREMQAMRGRASYTGERSIGSLDAGAVAVAVLLEALAEHWEDPATTD